MSRTTRAMSQAVLSQCAAVAATYHPGCSPVSSVPYPTRYHQMPTKYAACAACQISMSRQRGRASTASGSSQSTNCGE
jgi:hypothetical protein